MEYLRRTIKYLLCSAKFKDRVDLKSCSAVVPLVL
jgi:hypothetical protein